MEFQINKYISVKLEKLAGHKRRRTVIYINEEEFIHCKYILLEIPKDKWSSEEINEISSIDDAAEKLGRQLEPHGPDWEEDIDKLNDYLSDEEEFWAHCSNLQAWAEYGYDTRFLRSNLAFPLLKELIYAGDPKAKRIFKEEVVKRYIEGDESVRTFLILQGYISKLSIEERDLLFGSDRDQNAIKELEEIFEKTFVLRPPRYTNRTHLVGGSFGLRNRKVIWINLSSETLRQLPLVLKELKNIEFLELYFPNVTEIPEWIGEFPKLKQLIITQTPIKTLPENIGNLKNLEKLVINWCHLEKIPISIKKLKLLVELDLNKNKLKELPESIGNLSSLESLSLMDNKINLLPDSFGKLENLKELLISKNEFTIFPDFIRKHLLLY
ncbi:MAG: leucine-rich repeat domain-containing protein [Candidatus Lokiarchaeota archaeon]